MRRSCNKSSVKYLWKTDDKELEYNNSCLSHRFFSRNCSKRCRSRSASSNRCACEGCASHAMERSACPCCKQKQNDPDHFCTASSVASSYRPETAHSLNSSDQALLSALSVDNQSSFSSNKMNDSALVVCENYSPSYLSKKDQMESVQKEIRQLRLSKSIMRKTMQEIDKLLDESDPDKCAGRDMNPVERFYRSDKFIGSSMNVTSLNKDLPRGDIAPPKYIFELNKQKKPEERLFPLYGTAIFSLKDPHAFTDKTILNHELKNKPKKPAASKLARPKSAAAIVYYRSQLKTK